MNGSWFILGGYAAGVLVFFLEARRRQLVTEGMGWIFLAGICGGVLGARLTSWALLHGEQLAANPLLILDPRVGGRTLLGGVIGGWVAVVLVKRRLGIKRSTGDLFALSLPIGEAVGRIGCYLNGCCHGTQSDLPWAIYQHGAWRHPAQLYSALASAALFMVLLLARGKMRREGDLLKLYLVLYGVCRFSLEFVRERDLMFSGLSLVQWVCLFLMAVFSLELCLTNRRSLSTMRLED